MADRKELISELTDTINARENTQLTVNQVEHYIGSDMDINTLNQWVEDTVSGIDPVSSDDVLSLCEDLEPEQE